jgi:hypothetical protein
MTQEQDQKNNNTNTSASDIDIEAKLKQAYDELSEDEKKIVDKFDQKISDIIKEKIEHKYDHLENDDPLDFNLKHPDVMHPKHITSSPHEITVFVKAEVSDIDNKGNLSEIKDLFEKYYHIPVPNNTDYMVYVTKFFEKFHSDLEITCQEIHTQDNTKK